MQAFFASSPTAKKGGLPAWVTARACDTAGVAAAVGRTQPGPTLSTPSSAFQWTEVLERSKRFDGWLRGVTCDEGRGWEERAASLAAWDKAPGARRRRRCRRSVRWEPCPRLPRATQPLARLAAGTSQTQTLPVLNPPPSPTEARFCHPREEHLLPLHVCFGASAGDAGRPVWNDAMLNAMASSVQWG